MQKTKYRAQILLEPEQHAALAKITRMDNRSISELVREIVGQWLAEHDRETRLQRELDALQALTDLRLKIQEEHGVYTDDLIEATRAERDDDIDRTWRGEA